jgi:hypothetical protein
MWVKRAIDGIALVTILLQCGVATSSFTSNSFTSNSFTSNSFTSNMGRFLAKINLSLMTKGRFIVRLIFTQEV